MGIFHENYKTHLCVNHEVAYTKLNRQGGEGISKEKWKEINLEIQHLSSTHERY